MIPYFLKKILAGDIDSLNLLVCSKFNSVRENFLFPWYSRGDSKAEFFSLMKVSTPDIVRKICIYINEILKIKDKEYKL